MTDMKQKTAAPDVPTASAPARKSRRRLAPVLVVLAGAILILILSYTLPPFRNYQLATVGAYLCVTAGLTVLTGLNGQLSLGHGALMATGAYTFALSQNKWLSLPLSFVLAIVVTTVAGAVIGLAAARLRGPYLAGLTLAVAIVVPSVTSTFDETFNSDQGLSVVLDPPPGTIPMERWQAWLCWAGALVTVLVLAMLVRGRFGRDLRAVRDDETAAKLAGINIARTQVMAFVVSAVCAGLSGALFALLAQSVSPGAFPLTLSLFLVMAIVIGGLGSLFGALWGAVLLVALPALAQSVAEQAGSHRLEGNLALVVFGVVLIVVMLAAPGGLASIRLSSIRSTFIRRFRRER
ncbi:putative branched-chain amino acid ABC transporter permease protein [Actinoplanes missouriensis 431]|uniref:Putative branched-chain amino acid ABC transporter permease protein n=1 Tax=Actinoplanes missouriensis (strain ATCC 14538 / DSM 43046 / CBS 188.64 / JCM 3121 / NBRC 102363 / NCIMB 12654 / NRRL B-3342 / UNCC 431) TaxID=512565 RepID=I0HHW4_ACTM4|nr:branched-chain amino acid ABC transporter permease [Actinoplanes missouriensis]BAL92601.1 putative branched-chain amino acid ABC transporter permease protein [Actinoplanes missouriensis 431]